MNKSRPVATETVKSLNYTKNILQTIPNNDKMEVVTQTNAVKSPNDIYGDGIIYYQVANAAKHQYYIFTITPKGYRYASSSP